MALWNKLLRFLKQVDTYNFSVLFSSLPIFNHYLDENTRIEARLGAYSQYFIFLAA